jgi:glycosyltransferase involved in cell wall biosynthesis
MKFTETESIKELPLYVVVTATDRSNFHLKRTIPSLLRQSKKWDNLIVVDDSTHSSVNINDNFFSANLPSFKLLENKKLKGAAGAWNTAIDYINELSDDGWVAILDDDDEWTTDHLESCLKLTENNLDAVISSIITIVDGVPSSIPFNGRFTIEDFLCRNPGWQGSNTFVRLSALNKAGKFDENLVCTHDRDLAIRLLELKDFTYVRTGTTTVKYHIGSNDPAFTRRLNPQKLSGLRTFWIKHNSKMTEDIKQNFFKHAFEMFGFHTHQIIENES